MINVAVVGYGYSGRAFQSYLISQTQGLNLYAICTRDPGRQKDARETYPKARIYSDYGGLLSDESVQLVVLGTPHDTHHDLAVQAMDAGKHVVTDKVMCLNAGEARSMIEARDRNNVVLSVFHNRRWDWDYLTVKRAIQDGLIGDPYLYQVAVMRYKEPVSWRADKAVSGGILYDWPAHFVDQALQLVPASPSEVFCQIVYGEGWRTDIGNYGNLLIRFENGALYQMEIGNLAAIEKPRWYVCGSEGALIKHGLDPQEEFLKKGRILEAEEDPSDRVRVVSFKDGNLKRIALESVRGTWTSYYQNISDVLNRGMELEVKPEQMLLQMEDFRRSHDLRRGGEVRIACMITTRMPPSADSSIRSVLPIRCLSFFEDHFVAVLRTDHGVRSPTLSSRALAVREVAYPTPHRCGQRVPYRSWFGYTRS